MVKKDKKYKELDLKQSKLKSALHTSIRAYKKYRIAISKGSTKRAPVTMNKLQKQQDSINEIREQLDKRKITLIKDMKKSLVHL